MIVPKLDIWTLLSGLLVFVVTFLGLRYIDYVADLALMFCAIYMTEVFLKWIKDPFRTRSLISDLRGKSILITGCDTGFGHEMARRLDNIGVTVFAGCLFPEGPGAQELRKSSSSNLHVIPLNVEDDDQIDGALDNVKKLLGDKQLWAVVNNAGIATTGDFEIIPMKKSVQIINVNAIGPLRVTKAFLPLIRKAHGRIVIVASMAGRFSPPELVPYCMSKYAAVAFADSLRREMMKFGVTVHTIEPWFYKTNISSVENQQTSLKQNWAETTEEVTAAYGGEIYLNAHFKEMEEEQSNMRPPSKMYEVVNAMIHASLGEDPEIRYEVGTHWFSKFLIQLPVRWVDCIVYKPLPSN